MGSNGSKDVETNNIKEVEEMNEDEMSSKDKIFKKAILEVYEELKAVKNQKKDKFIYTIPRKWICVIGVYFRLILYKYKIIFI